jgi:hypothetical protein
MRFRLTESLLLVAVLLVCSSLLATDQTTTLDNDAIVQMVKWHLTPAEINAAIKRNQTNFDLSPSTVKSLTANGVSSEVLRYMFDATISGLKAPASGGATRTAVVKQSASQQPQKTPPPPTQVAVTKSPAAAQSDGTCWVHLDPQTASGSNTQYSYQFLCDSGITPSKMAIVMPVITKPTGFALEQGISEQKSSSDAKNTTFTFTFSPGADTRRLSLTVPTASIEVGSATYYIASGGIKDPGACQAAPSTAGCFVGEFMVPVPKAPPALAAAKCPGVPYFPSVATPTLNPIEADATALKGTVKGATTGTVQICAAGKPLGDPVTVGKDGSFGLTIPSGTKLTNGEAIVPQYIEPGTDGGADKFGPTSDASTVLVGDCSKATPSTGSAPVLNLSQPDTNGKVTYSGTTDSSASGSVRICVNHVPNADAKTAPIKGGKFDGGSNSFKVQANDKVVAQIVSADSPPKYSPLSTEQPVNSAGLVVGPASTSDDNKLVTSFIGGVEQSGFSSQGSNTNGFLSAYARSRFYSSSTLAPALWGRVRLLSGPLPSSVNVVAALTNPAGTITTSNLQNVGQVVDYVIGPELRLKQWGNTERISLFGGIGATSPLNSGQIQYSLQAPPADSQQCFQLVSRYPTFFANNAKNTSTNCTLVNAVTSASVSTISFAPIDRSDFLMKYGAGLRFTHTYPAKGNQAAYSGSIDISIGQDQSITGGTFHGAVFRLDAVYPLAFGASPYLYLFGSASMKTTKNVNEQPLVLSTAPAPALPLPTSVVVVPLTQPDRDFYRFGVGVNITAIFCKMTTNGCTNNSSAPASDSTTPPASSAPAKTPTKTTGAAAAAPATKP